VFNPVVYDPLRVDMTHATRRRVHQMDVRQVKRWQEFVVKSGPLTSIRVVWLKGRGGLGVLDDSVYPSPDLLHDPETRVQLLLHQLLGRQLGFVVLSLSEISDPTSEVVIVGLDRRAALGDTGESRPAGSRPARLTRPLIDLRLHRFTLVTYIDG